MSMRGSGKLHAFGIHLGISAGVVAAALGVVFLFWYPPPYFQVIGTWTVLRVLIGVDLILGPLLTLIVFRRGKPRLLLDLSLIAAIQLGALIYGLTVIYQERPYAAVFVVDRFEILTKGEVDLTRIPPALGSKPARGPLLVIARVPEDPAERMALIEEVLAGKPDIEYRPQYWHPYALSVDTVLAKAKPLEELLPPPNLDDTAAARAVLARYASTAARVVFLPIMGKAGPATLLLDSTSGHPLDAVAVRPWPDAPRPVRPQPAT